MKKEFLVPEGFSEPKSGYYSHGVKVNNTIYVTGQIALDASGEVVGPHDATIQTEFIFKNIEKILAEGGAKMSDIVKVQIFITDMADYAKVGELRKKYLSEAKPASTLVQVSGLFKPECCVEIEVMAII